MRAAIACALLTGAPLAPAEDLAFCVADSASLQRALAEAASGYPESVEIRVAVGRYPLAGVLRAGDGNRELRMRLLLRGGYADLDCRVREPRGGRRSLLVMDGGELDLRDTFGTVETRIEHVDIEGGLTRLGATSTVSIKDVRCHGSSRIEVQDGRVVIDNSILDDNRIESNAAIYTGD